MSVKNLSSTHEPLRALAHGTSFTKQVAGVKDNPNPKDSQPQAHARSGFAYGKSSESHFATFPIPTLFLHDVPEARIRQRQRVTSLLSQSAAFYLQQPEWRSYLQQQLEWAERFDLTILDSGNLYWNGQLLNDPKLSQDQNHLIAEQTDGTKIQIPLPSLSTQTPRLPSHDVKTGLSHLALAAEQEVEFHYSRLFESAAILVGAPEQEPTRFVRIDELADSLPQRISLPENYLDTISFLPALPSDITLPNPRRVTQLINDEDLDPADRIHMENTRTNSLAMQAYKFKIGDHCLEIRIPDPQSPLSRSSRQSGFYIPTEADVLEILKGIVQLVPKAFFPKNIKFAILPRAFEGQTLAVADHETNTVFLPSDKFSNLQEWMSRRFLVTLQHEMMHMFHADLNEISTLFYRTMLLDGWSMDYGKTDISEYIAVLAEKFFDEPDQAKHFPNGFALLHLLIQKREQGLRWSRFNAPQPLIDLNAGLPPTTAKSMKPELDRTPRKQAFQAVLAQSPLLTAVPETNLENLPIPALLPDTLLPLPTLPLPLPHLLARAF